MAVEEEGGEHLPAVDEPGQLGMITPHMDSRNSYVFSLLAFLTYLAVPVTFVDVVQAALCNKLHASTMVANLPAGAYFLGGVSAIFYPWLVPHRMARNAVVWTCGIMSVLLAIVCATLALPCSDKVKIAVVIGQAFVLSPLQGGSVLYRYVCLGRGTTERGRAKALKLAYSIGPIIAVAGSLGAQFVLNHGIPALHYPYDFSFLYLVGAVCAAVSAIVATRYEIVPVPDEEHQPIFRYLASSIKSFFAVRKLALLWAAFLLWNAAFSGIANLSLLTKHALGRDPAEFSGIILALRFGFKSVSGFVLGGILLRWGDRAPLLATTLLVGGATLWAGLIPGYAFLLAFGFLGASELAGVYFPNYTIAASSHADNARNQSIFSLGGPLLFIFPPLYGFLTERFGDPASLALGVVMAILAFVLILKMPANAAAS